MLKGRDGEGGGLRHPVPLEVRERRMRDLLERLAEAIARAGYGDVSHLDFMSPRAAEQVRGLAQLYRDQGVEVEPEWGDTGSAVARFPDDRAAPVSAELVVDDRSVLRAPGCVLPSRQRWRLLIEADGLCRRIERLQVEALA